MSAKGPPPDLIPFLISPHLKCVTLNTRPSRHGAHTPWHQSAALVQIIPVLTTSLEHLSLLCGPEKDGPLGDIISSLIHWCGPLLRSFDTCVPLSEAAIHHLTWLPNPHGWTTVVQGPPRAVPLLILLPFEELRLGEQAILLCVHSFVSREKGIPRNGPIPATDAGMTLKSLQAPSSIQPSYFSSQDSGI